jgi:hypothetical protein
MRRPQGGFRVTWGQDKHMTVKYSRRYTRRSGRSKRAERWLFKQLGNCRYCGGAFCSCERAEVQR